MRRALYLSILSVPPAFSIAGATREAKIALCIDLIDLKFAYASATGMASLLTEFGAGAVVFRGGGRSRLLPLADSSTGRREVV